MQTIVSALLEISVYAAVVAGATLLFRAVFYRRMSPRFRYLTWMLLALRLALPVTLECGFHVENLLPKPAQTAAAVTALPDAVLEAAAPAIGAGPASAAASAAASADPVPSMPKQEVDWYAAACYAWLCGMGVYALWLGFAKLRYYRRMRALRLETPPAVLALYETCRAELGVRRRMPVWIADAAMSPGIVLFGAPVLLLPANMVSTPEALRFAMLHELTHQKRGDHIATAVVNLLRVVYWFHPAVHVSFLLMRDDMETACDFDVMRRLRGDEKKGYLTTIINLFSYQTRPQLSMASSHTRRMAERRVKGAFMKNMTSPASGIVAAALAALLLLTCFTTACGKAPAAGAARNVALPGVETPAPPEGQALRGSYAVYYDGDADASGVMNENICRAAGRINADGGVVVQPGESWSFNDFFGPATEENGWLPPAEAAQGESDAAYLGAEYAASALYGALLCADVEVTQRSACTDAPADLAKGLDAAVLTAKDDLKFTNNTGAPLIVQCALWQHEHTRERITFTLWGEALPGGISYTLRSNVTQTNAGPQIVIDGIAYTPSNDASLPGGEAVVYVDDPALPRGMRRIGIAEVDGYQVVEVYRDAVQSGRVVSSELIYTEAREARIGVFGRGTKTPYLLTDRSKDELKALAKRLRAYRYDSTAHTFDEACGHYAKLFDELEIDCGGMEGGDGVSFTVGVPMVTFEFGKCYPYAAVLFALDPGVLSLDLCSMEYSGLPEDTLRLTRADVEKHYARVLQSPLQGYTQSDVLMEELLLLITQ